MSDNIFDKLQQRYPGIRHAPDTNCTRCDGAGERYVEYSIGIPLTSGWKPCLCLSVEHEHLRIVDAMKMRRVKTEIPQAFYDAFQEEES